MYRFDLFFPIKLLVESWIHGVISLINPKWGFCDDLAVCADNPSSLIVSFLQTWSTLKVYACQGSESPVRSKIAWVTREF